SGRRAHQTCRKYNGGSEEEAPLSRMHSAPIWSMGNHCSISTRGRDMLWVAFWWLPHESLAHCGRTNTRNAFPGNGDVRGLEHSPFPIIPGMNRRDRRGLVFGSYVGVVSSP